MALLTLKEYQLLYEANEDTATFDGHAKFWYDKVIINVNKWRDPTLLSLVDKPPTKATVLEIKNEIHRGPNRPGKEEILHFIDELLLNAFRDEFKDNGNPLEGKTGAIHEFLLLLKQSIDL